MKFFILPALALLIFNTSAHSQIPPHQMDELRQSAEAFLNSDEYKKQREVQSKKSALKSKLASQLMIRQLKMMLDEPGLLELLSFTKEQQELVPTLIGSIYDLDKNQMNNSKRLPIAEYKETRNELVDDLIDTNVDFQSTDMTSLGFENGLYRTLYRSELLRLYLEMDDEQRDRIKEKAERLASKMTKQIEEFRFNSAKLLESELTNEQKKKLDSFYGNKAIDGAFQRMPVEAVVMTMFGINDLEEGRKKLIEMRPVINIFQFQSQNK